MKLTSFQACCNTAPRIVGVEGYALTICGLPVVVHRRIVNPRRWDVSEPESGFAITTAPGEPTRKAAIATAERTLTEHGPKKTARAVKKAIKTKREIAAATLAAAIKQTA